MADSERARVLTDDRYAEVVRVLKRVLVANLAVASAKIGLGYATGTVSILSDGFHSLTDGASNVVALVGVAIASALGFIAELWWFTDEGPGTHVKWTYTAESRTWLAMPLLFPIIRILWNRYMQSSMRLIKTRAEKEITVVAAR